MEPITGVDCLRDLRQVTEARRVMQGEGRSCLSHPAKRFLHRWRLHPGPVVGDWLKSWDVNKVLEAILVEITRDEPIADFGAYGCEILPALWQAGYSNLYGIDLNPRLASMPGAGPVRYVIGDFMTSPLKDASMAAVTSISVIEHGYDGTRLFREISRVLRPGGLFLASFDYWPDKINTTGIRLFGMDWRIFSRSEVQEMCALAESFGLRALPGGSLDCAAPVIHWGGKSYTFGLLALRKDR